MRVYTYCIILAAVFLIITLYYVKRRKLDFHYCMLWILVSLVLCMLSLNKNIVENAAVFTGISYAPAFLFVTGIVFSLILIFYLTLVISSLQKRIIRLTQEIGILKSKMEGNEYK